MRVECAIDNVHSNSVYLLWEAMSNFTPKIIKPCRTTLKSPELKTARCIKNHKKGVETSLILDLNILSKMREVVGTRSVKYQHSGLSSLVNTLNKMPAIYISPGFAITEANKDYRESLMESYEIFLERYCPGFIDTPNSTKNYKNLNSKPSEFVELGTVEKYFNSVAYLGILRIQLEERKAVSDPQNKYENYLNYMIEHADMVGAVESEAAKYVFSNIEDIKDPKFKAFSSKIRKNFKKGGNSSEKLLKNCLNAARDIMYYRAAADRSNEYIDGKLQDTWLVTADDGLFNLSQSIHFVPKQDENDSKYFSMIRGKEQKKSPYWSYCDDVTICSLNYRQLVREQSNAEYGFTDTDFERLLNCIAETENELSHMFSAK